MDVVKELAAYTEIRGVFGNLEIIGLGANLPEEENSRVMATIKGLAVLAQHGDRSIVNCLSDDDPEVKAAAVDAAKKLLTYAEIRALSANAETVGKIVSILDAPEWQVRLATINALGDLAEYPEIRTLVATSDTVGKVGNCLADDDSDVQAAAIDTVEKLVGYGMSGPILLSSHAHVLQAAIRALFGAPGIIGERANLPAADDRRGTAIINGLAALVTHSMGTLVFSSARTRFFRDEIRAFIGTPEIIEKVVSCLTDSDPNVAAAAVDSVRKLAVYGDFHALIGTRDIILKITTLLICPYWQAQVAAIDALAGLAEHQNIRVFVGTPDTMGKIVGCLADYDRDVRAAAINTVKKLAGYQDIRGALQTPELVRNIISLLTHGHWRVRMVNIQSLAELAEQAEHLFLGDPEIIGNFVRCLNDDDQDVREATIDAGKLVRLSGQLVKLLGTEDWRVKPTTISTLVELAEHCASIFFLYR
ncbi:armadillo-type protein [Mycena maculata]|uniref:Armadillo-type protein n=1 Tax=Mycena maculata TaxID=230809 RepID=A0AAD7NWB4_9AGAR|nr:armadillo-type protein [Mycena maculata]